MNGAGDMLELELVVASVTSLTPAIKAFVLRSANGAPLPPFAPGAHVGVQVMQPNGRSGQRAYSLAKPHDGSDATRSRCCASRKVRAARPGCMGWWKVPC
jgi:ferredoxin-NADP reductase